MFRWIITSLMLTSNAFGWGDYAHQQIHKTAVDLLAAQNHPLSTFLKQYEKILLRVSTVPDQQWAQQTSGNGQNSTQEHRLHFFQVDAFAKSSLKLDSILELPQKEYSFAYRDYQQAISSNLDFIQANLPADISAKKLKPESFGTAPWRALQLYDLMTRALRAKDVPTSIVYLSSFAHYLSDMAEPFHTTLNFDGEHYPTSAAGIHNSFTKYIFEQAAAAKHPGAKTAQIDSLWCLVATNEFVSEKAQNDLGTKGLDGLTRERVLPEIFRLIYSGFKFIDPLLKSYSEQCLKLQEEHHHDFCEIREVSENGKMRRTKELSSELIQAFSTSRIGNQTVLEIAEIRLAEAAMLTARFWSAAYREAGSPELPNMTVEMKSLKLEELYPAPDYLPVSKKLEN